MPAIIRVLIGSMLILVVASSTGCGEKSASTQPLTPSPAPASAPGATPTTNRTPVSPPTSTPNQVPASAPADPPKKENEDVLKIEMPGHVQALAITPDGSTVVLAFADALSDCVKTWDLKTGRLKSKLPVSIAYTMQLAADGTTVAVSTGKIIEVWDLKTKKQIVSIDQGDITAGMLALRPDGKQLASANTEQKMILVWELPSGKLIRKIQDREDEVLGLTFTPDGKFLVSTEYSGFQFYSADTGELKNKLNTQQAAPRSLTYRPDGNQIAYASGPLSEPKNAVLVVDAQTGKTIHTLLGHQAAVSQIVWSRDGALLASVTVDENAPVLLWDAEKGEKLAEFKWDNPPKEELLFSAKLAFSTDGKSLIAAGHYQGLRVWPVKQK